MGDRSILVVDDDFALNAMLGMHLQDAGFHVAGARSCREALYLLADRDFALALVDYRLPDGTGLDILRGSREVVPHTGFIMITGVHDADLRRDAIAAGASDLLRKPVSLVELDAAVHRALADRTIPA